jgi:uncharacterized protein YdiU (UPF0061 family)
MNFHFDNSYGKLPESFYIPTNPTQVPEPSVLFFNDHLARELDLSPDNMDMDEAAALFSGNKLIHGTFPIATAYAGHQFGHFTMLGDGRAILLGEHITKVGNRFDIQLKGSGHTAFSRGGDGRATLRAMLREYLISEAMAGLKIPTTRSLAMVKTGGKVYREEIHEGAILTRIASSHIRVGTFEFAHRFVPNESSVLLDYVIDRHYPELNLSKSKASDLLKEVMLRQIDLIVEWMRVGFIHGVMNTDNMSIAGETLDYGPCAFMNTYHPETVFSSIDTQGRYAFGNQPSIAQWNLACFAGSLLSIIHEDRAMAIEIVQEILNSFPAIYQEKWQGMMFEKLGFSSEINLQQRKNSLSTLLAWMTENKADYTNTFLVLQGDMPMEGIYLQEEFQIWFSKWQNMERGKEAVRLKKMRENNPLFIPRNHLVEKALDEASLNDNLWFFKELLEYCANPYTQTTAAAILMKVPDNIDKGYKTYCGT